MVTNAHLFMIPIKKTQMEIILEMPVITVLMFKTLTRLVHHLLNISHFMHSLLYSITEGL